MSYKSDNRNGSLARKIAPLAAIALSIGSPSLSAQVNVQEVPDVVKGEAQRHFHSPDMSCCAPCAPETNQDADVFKRPCFVRALQRSLEKPKKAFDGLTDTVAVKLRGESIPASEKEGFQSMVGVALRHDFLPRRWEDTELVVPHAIKRVTEQRGSARVFVGHEAVDLELKDLKKGDAIQTAWMAEGIEVLPRVPYHSGSRLDMVVRLRLDDDQRLEFRRRSKHREVMSGSPEWEQWIFFDKVAFHEFLTKVFRVPFRTPDDFVIHGFDAEYEGVGVFHGTIVSRTRGRVWVGGENPPQHWWDQMQLLVTDSDPQYFCVQITLGPGDKVEALEP